MAITKFIKDLFVVDIEEEVPAPQKKKPQTSSKVTNLNQTKVIDNRPKAAQKKQTVSKVITPKSKVQKQQVQKQQVEQKNTRIDSKENRTMPINNQSTKVCLFEPRVFAETQDIADELKSNRAALVNLTKIDGTPKKRIVDFLSGTVYALEGDIQKVGTDIFLCTPNDFGVEGEISDKEEYFDET